MEVSNVGALKITTSRVFDKLHHAFENPKNKVIVLEGSARSTKTYSIIQYLIGVALRNDELQSPKDIRITIIRKRLTWLKSSVLRDFKTILKDQFGIWDDKCYNKNSNEYVLGRTVFGFTGLDHDEGQKFKGDKCDYAWLNEANEVDYPTVSQVLYRLEGKMIIDYNPNIDSNHWIELHIKKRDDVIVLHSTFRDNPFLKATVVKEIEQLEPTAYNIEHGTADENAWKIYGLGVRAIITGLIYKNYTLVDEMPKVDWERRAFGLDFGFTNDPTAMVDCGIFNGGLYLDEKIYERGLTNIINPKNMTQLSIEGRFIELGIKSTDIIFADSAEPKSIRDLQNCGYQVKPCVKGAGSVLDGIASVKRYKMHVTADSLNIITELNRYKWLDGESEGTSINKPIKGFDHSLDATRYCVPMIADDIDGSQTTGQYDSCKHGQNFDEFGMD